MKDINKHFVRALALTAVCVALTVQHDVRATSSNGNHEIMVYSLEQYGNLTDVVTGQTTRWKHDIPLDNDQDPYYDFWDEMDCSSSSCMHHDSVRRRNYQVTVNNMAWSSNGWSDGDLVFFYGHNTMIQPQWEDTFWYWKYGYWIGYGSGWHVYDIQWTDWGTSMNHPYQYHRYIRTDASLSNSFSIFYAYNPATSILIGKDYTGSSWVTENTWNQSTGDTRSGKLGDDDIEWLVGHGCNAVTVALADGNGGVDPTPLGVNAWKKSWSKMHIVMGHYQGTFCSWEPDLNDYADALKGGETMKEANFGIHADAYGSPSDPHWPAQGQPAAIMKFHEDCCYINPFFGIIVCTPSCSKNYFLHDKWDSLVEDPTSGATAFMTAYEVSEE
jgi:hypothetical protein